MRVPAFRLHCLVALLCLVSGAAGVAGGAVLEGAVLEHRSGRPLARCRISLELLQAGMAVPLKTALTDSAGRFRFLDLAADAYLLSAERTGYATGRYGQQRWNGAGTPIVLAADSHFFAELRLRRLGAVVGEVLDENQIGLPGIGVAAYAAGRQPMRLAGSGASDDRGVFRIPGLPPGRYYIRTTAHELEDRRGLLPTYFGQTTRVQEARLVEVELDSEARGTNIEPLAGKLGRISGKVLGGAATSVMLFTETGKRDTMPGADGDFTFDQLAPGEYELLALGTMRSLAGWRKVSVGEGTNPVGLELGPLPVIQVRVEASDGRTVEGQSVRLVLKRRGLSEELPAAALAGGQTETVMPGQYSVWAQAPPEFYVQSLRTPQDGRGSAEFTAAPRQSIEVVVTVSSRPARLRGTVRTADGQPAIGAPVLLNAIEPELRSRIGGVRVTRADESGGYDFRGLPPGQYQVFSSFQFQDPEQADWGAAPGGAVALEEGQEATLDLRLGGG